MNIYFVQGIWLLDFAEKCHIFGAILERFILTTYYPLQATKILLGIISKIYRICGKVRNIRDSFAIKIHKDFIVLRRPVTPGFSSFQSSYNLGLYIYGPCYVVFFPIIANKYSVP